MTGHSDQPTSTQLRALQALIAERIGEDPLIGPKLASEVALEKLLEKLTTERGVHAETLMAAAGILMGLSAQASLWAEAQQDGTSSVAGLHIGRCQDDSCFVFGDPLNRRLLEGYDSPWELLTEAAKQEGCEDFPQAGHLLLEGMQRLCTPEFGMPRVPDDHRPELLAQDQRVELWLMVLPLCIGCCSGPREWPLLCGLVAVRALRLATTQIPAALAWRLAMDSAIDASKIPLDSLA